MVLLLLIYLFYVPPIVCGDSVLVFVLVVITLCLDEEERAGCFLFMVFGTSCYCTCFVGLPHGAVG